MFQTSSKVAGSGKLNGSNGKPENAVLIDNSEKARDPFAMAVDGDTKDEARPVLCPASPKKRSMGNTTLDEFVSASKKTKLDNGSDSPNQANPEDM